MRRTFELPVKKTLFFFELPAKPIGLPAKTPLFFRILAKTPSFFMKTRFGFPLFYRNRNQCILTENGKLLLEQCREAVKAEAQVEETALALNGLMTGTLRIGSVNSMPSGISFTPLFRDPVLLILPADHIFCRYEKVPAELLNNCDFIMPEEGYDDVYTAITKGTSISPHTTYRVGSTSAAAGMVENHLGVTVMSGLEAAHISGDIVKKRFTKDFYRTMGYAVNAKYRRSPAAKAFLQAAEEHAEKAADSLE